MGKLWSKITSDEPMLTIKWSGKSIIYAIAIIETLRLLNAIHIIPVDIVYSSIVSQLLFGYNSSAFGLFVIMGLGNVVFFISIFIRGAVIYFLFLCRNEGRLLLMLSCIISLIITILSGDLFRYAWKTSALESIYPLCVLGIIIFSKSIRGYFH